MARLRWVCLLLLIAGVARTDPPSPLSTADDLCSAFKVQALRDTRDKTLVNLMVQVDRPTVAMGFDVSFRIGKKTLPVGPMAWARDKIKWWAYDVDVPVDVNVIEVVFTPSAKAVAQLRQIDEDDVRGIDTIWDGQVIVKDVKLSEQRLGGMSATSMPRPEVLRETFVDEMDGRTPAITQSRKGGDNPATRAELELALQKNLRDPITQYNLGCLAAAVGEWQRAVECFGPSRDAEKYSALADKAQHQLRRIGGYLAHAADRRDVPAMFTLAVMYDKAWGPSRDRQTAKRWYRNAANAGHAAAMTRLGAMYAEDLVAQTDPNAQAWYRNEIQMMFHKAAELGNEEARTWLATHAQH